MAQLLIRGQLPHFRHGFIVEELGFKQVNPGDRLDLDDTMIRQLCDRYGRCVERVEAPVSPPRRRQSPPKNKMEPESQVEKTIDDDVQVEVKED